MIYWFPRVFCSPSPLHLCICSFLCWKAHGVHTLSTGLLPVTSVVFFGKPSCCPRLSWVPLLWVAMVPSAYVYPVLITVLLVLICLFLSVPRLWPSLGRGFSFICMSPGPCTVSHRKCLVQVCWMTQWRREISRGCLHTWLTSLSDSISLQV